MNPAVLRSASATILTGLAVAALSILFFAWLSEEVMENDTARFDDHIRALIHGKSQPFLTQAMEVASDAGSPAAVGLLTLTAFVIFWIWRRRQDAVVLAAAIVGASVLGYVLKTSFHRARPVPFFGLATPRSFAFPSGHALVALCFYVVLAHLVNSRIRPFGVRTGIWASAVFIFLVIGFSRIYLGVHYPSDVVAGYLAGTVWVATIVLAEHLARRSTEPTGVARSKVSKVSSKSVWLFVLSFLFARSFIAETISEQTAIRVLDQAEARRESRLAGYAVTEHYTLRGSRFFESAEMTVETVYQRGQGKSFHVVSRSGSSMLQSRVFDRLLREESEMSRGEARQRTLVNSENYAMRLAGEDIRAGRSCYVLELTPRIKSTHLVQGRAWIDKEDGSLIRIEGIPAVNPSFLTGRPTITREYEKVGEFWLAQSSRSVSDSFIFSKTELSIEYRDYHILHDVAGR